MTGDDQGPFREDTAAAAAAEIAIHALGAGALQRSIFLQQRYLPQVAITSTSGIQLFRHGPIPS